MKMSLKNVTLYSAALVLVGTAAAMAQNRAAVGDTDSMGQLVSEVRSLRAAIEDSMRTQSQTYALGSQLTAQEARLTQIRAQLAAAQKEMDDSIVRVADASAESSVGITADAETQDAYAKVLKRKLDKLLLEEQNAKARYTELTQSLQAENGRWSELVARLEHVGKK